MFEHAALQRGEFEPVRFGGSQINLRKWLDWLQRCIQSDAAPAHAVNETADAFNPILVQDQCKRRKRTHDTDSNEIRKFALCRIPFGQIAGTEIAEQGGGA